MPRLLSSLFALYTLTPGRRIYALGRVRERALAKELTVIVAAIDAAIAQDRHALDIDAARLAPTKSPPVRQRDTAVDRTLAVIHRLLSHFAAGEDSAVPSALLSNLFPINLAHHVRLPFVEQAAANERVLAVVEGEAHKTWLDNHGLRPLIVQLRTTHDEFAAALHARDDESAPSWDEVKAARESGQELYLQVVARVIVQFIEDPEARDELLEPVWDQEALIRAYRRQRRTVVDVDPDTGEPLPEDESESEGEGSGDEVAAEEAVDAEPEPVLA